MKFLVAGLGSMGKRRVRCLKALGYENIVGFDVREDRRKESKEKYGIEVLSKLPESLNDFDALIISTPPDLHIEYIQMGLKYNIPCFVEASVIVAGLNEIDQVAKSKNVFVAPSCTLKFHPMIKEIKKITQSKKYGKLCSLTYNCGQYLPDWHPWEKVTDYYVSKKETGGAREIVAFELTWLADVIGKPVDIKGYYGKTMDVGADIDDTYVAALKWDGGYGAFQVDVTARFFTRFLLMNFETAQVRWDWDNACLRIFDSKDQKWTTITQEMSEFHPGYNKNILEEIYVNEIKSFISGIKDPSTYPSDLQEDIGILTLMNKIEESHELQ